MEKKYKSQFKKWVFWDNKQNRQTLSQTNKGGRGEKTQINKIRDENGDQLHTESNYITSQVSLVK